MGEKKNPFGLAVTAGAAAAAALYARSEYEKKHFVVDRYTIRTTRITGMKTLVFLSDLHENRYPGSDGKNRLAEAVRELKPDAILIGGDMIVKKGSREEYAVTLELLADICDLCPVIYADGNHEDRMDASVGMNGRFRHPFFEEMRRLGVIWLYNDSMILPGNLRVTSCRVTDELYRHFFTEPVMKEHYILERVGYADPDRFQIMLMHSPQFFRETAAWGADLTLSGHFHGGTIRIPGIGGLMTPQYQFFRKECAGEFSRGNRYMIVSRGLGTHSIDIRLNDLPEVVAIRLMPAVEDETGRE